LIAALAGAVLDHFSNLGEKNDDWLHRGQEVAVQLAVAATRPELAPVPRGCLLVNE